MDINSVWNSYNDLNSQAKDLAGGYEGGVTNAQNTVRNNLGYDSQQKNLNNIRQSVANTENTISTLPQNVQQRTAGRLVTNAQLNRITSAEQDPLVKQLGNLNNGLNVAQQGVNDINTQAADAGQNYTTGFNAKLAGFNSQAQGTLGLYNNLLQTNAANAAASRQADLQQAMLDFSKGQYNDQQAATAKANQDQLNSTIIAPTQTPNLIAQTKSVADDIGHFLGVQGRDLEGVDQTGKMSGLEYLYNQIFNPNYLINNRSI